MAQDAEQLKAEIARTREDLGGDLDLLAEKVTPSKVVGRRVDAAKGALSGVKERVMGSADSLSSQMGDAAGNAGSVVSGQVSSLGDARPRCPGRGEGQDLG